MSVRAGRPDHPGRAGARLREGVGVLLEAYAALEIFEELGGRII